MREAAQSAPTDAGRGAGHGATNGVSVAVLHDAVALGANSAVLGGLGLVSHWSFLAAVRVLFLTRYNTTVPRASGTREGVKDLPDFSACGPGTRAGRDAGGRTVRTNGCWPGSRARRNQRSVRSRSARCGRTRRKLGCPGGAWAGVSLELPRGRACLVSD